MLEEISSIESHLSPSSPIVFDEDWKNSSELRLAWSLARDARTKVETLNTVLYYFLKEEERKKQ